MEANVACRQLNGGTAIPAIPVRPDLLRKWNETGFYKPDKRSRKQWLDHGYCGGQEKRLIDCRYGSLHDQRTLLVYGYRHADTYSCLIRLEIVGVDCRGPAITTVPSTNITVPSRTTRVVTTSMMTGTTNSQPNDGNRKKTVPTSIIAGGDGTENPTVACALLLLDVIRKLSQAINLRSSCQQLRLQIALVEARNNELILYKEREKPAGEINIGVTTSNTAVIKLPTVATTDNTDRVYSKPTVVLPQVQAENIGNVSAGVDSTYSKVGEAASVSPDSSTSTNKTLLDVYSLPTPRCSRVSPELKKPNTNSPANMSDEDHDEGEDQRIVPPKAYDHEEGEA